MDLNKAIRNGIVETVRTLLKAGVDVNNDYGSTALTEASVNDRAEVIKIIKDQIIKDISFIPLGSDIVRYIVIVFLNYSIGL
jgi:ankyrin repeat protein